MARVRHLVPRRVRERFFPLYAVATGHMEVAARSWEQVESERMDRAVRRTDLFGELFDQRVLRLEARLARLEEQLGRHIDSGAHSLDDTIPLSDEEYLRYEGEFRADDELLAELYRPVAGMLDPGSDVLDLGSGTGVFLGLCQVLGHRAVGVDASEAMVRAAIAGGFKVTLDDAVSFVLSQPEASFDCVTAFHLVEHLGGKRLRTLFEEVFRILRPGGRFVVETPNVGSIKTMTDYYYVDPSHLLPRRVEQYVMVLEASGFSDVKIELVNEPQSPIQKLNEDTKSGPLCSDDPPVSSVPTVAIEEGVEARLIRIEEQLGVGSDVRLYALK